MLAFSFRLFAGESAREEFLASFVFISFSFFFSFPFEKVQNGRTLQLLHGPTRKENGELGAVSG